MAEHAATSGRVRCLVVTPEQIVLEREADFVAVPAFDGEVGVLPGRAPLVARLGAGELRLKQSTGQIDRYYIDGGFAQVLNNVVTILTPRAKAATELAADQAQRQLAEANAEVPTTDIAFAEKEKKLARAGAQLRLATHP